MHKNKSPFRYFNYVSIGHKNFEKQKNIILKGHLKTRSNSNPSKVHNYHLVKISQKNTSHLTL
jgi:hypothetical protein